MMVTIIFSLCVQSGNFHRWLTDDHAPSYVLKYNGEGAWSWKWRGFLTISHFCAVTPRFDTNSFIIQLQLKVVLQKQQNKDNP